MSRNKIAKDEISERMVYKDRTRKHNMKNEQAYGRADFNISMLILM